MIHSLHGLLCDVEVRSNLQDHNKISTVIVVHVWCRIKYFYLYNFLSWIAVMQSHDCSALAMKIEFCELHLEILRKLQSRVSKTVSSSAASTANTILLRHQPAGRPLRWSTFLLSNVISPEFSLELTGFFQGRHLIHHFLVLKMKDFRNFVLDNCILDFDAEKVYSKPQVTNLKNKEITANPLPQTLEKNGCSKTLTLNPKP